MPFPKRLKRVDGWIKNGTNDPDPIQTTCRRGSAPELIDIRLLDHFVVGGGECVAFAERGLL